MVEVSGGNSFSSLGRQRFYESSIATNMLNIVLISFILHSSKFAQLLSGMALVEPLPFRQALQQSSRLVLLM